MDFYVDWRFWGFVLSALTFVGVVIGNIVSKLTTDKIANNHLTHISEDLQKIKVEQDSLKDLVNDVKLDIAHVKGSLKVNNEVVSLLKETIKNK